MAKQIFIVEHLEPKLWPWCFIEYKSISKIVRKDRVWFTNIKDRAGKLKKFGKVLKESVKKMNLKNACVLDSEAGKKLSASDARKFDYFIFGGILGDYPSKKRTKEELTKLIKNAKARNLRKEQMSSDNAVYIVKKICQGKEIDKLKFIDKAEIKLNKIESVELPFRYVSVRGKPFMSQEIKRYLEEKKRF